jgi:hypothetical protein
VTPIKRTVKPRKIQIIARRVFFLSPRKKRRAFMAASHKIRPIFGESFDLCSPAR